MRRNRSTGRISDLVMYTEQICLTIKTENGMMVVRLKMPISRSTNAQEFAVCTDYCI